jgi:3-deoxy-manno-octulosonate cytidylyltransferase (CMP-KDO synthetase)
MILAVIPARYGSTRFPGKPLHLIAGKPLVQHVWERCQACQKLDHVVIATDDERIVRVCQAFGADVRMTSVDHPSGTDRMAEIASMFSEADILLNVQGDEPLISPRLIDALASAMEADLELPMITAAAPLTDPRLLEDPNVVKVTTTLQG